VADPTGNFCGLGVTPRREEALAAQLRSRVEAYVQGLGATVIWTRPERSAERDDFRARTGLDRAAADRLPSGRPWRGRAVRGRFFRRIRLGASIGFATSWSGLSQGENGAVTLGQAVACFEQERENWRQLFGSKPFYAAVAGVFQEAVGASPLDNLAILAWENGAWRFHGRESQPELADLFFPGPAEKFRPPARWQGMSNFREKLLSPFRNQHRGAEAKLAARTREFQEAKRRADQLQDECERHSAAGDWSQELLQIQLANAKEASRRADLLHRQVAALQQNLQLLGTAKLGADLIADSGLPIDADRFESLDRSYFESQARRQEVVRAERTLSDTLLAEEPANIDLPHCEEAVEKRWIEP
jgi:hypothetical protein